MIAALLALPSGQQPRAGAADQTKTEAVKAAETQPAKGLFGGDRINGFAGQATSIAFDRSGALWIGAADGGIFAYHHQEFTLFNQYNTPMRDTGIAKVFVDRKDRKWFVSNRGQLYLFDNQKWRAFETPFIGGPHNTVTCLCDDTEGNLWIGTSGGYVLRLNESAAATTGGISDESPGPPPLSGVSSLACDVQGRIWVSGWERGELPNKSVCLLRSDGKTWAPAPVHPKLFPIWKLFPDEATGEILFGSTDGVYACRDGDARLVTRRPKSARGEELWRAPDGRLVLGSREGMRVIEGDKVRRIQTYNLPYGLWVDDVAFDTQRRIWVGSRLGLFVLGGERLVSKGLREGLRMVNLTSRTWADKSATELFAQEVSNANIRDVLKDPAKYANQKLRVVGNLQTGFEFADMVDKDGQALGISPGMHLAWFMFLNSTGLDEELNGAEDDGHQDTGDRFTANLREWPPAPKKPTKAIEYVGYLDWGGYFGHLGGATRSFTAFEKYPTDLDPAKRAAIHKAYGRFCASLPAKPPVTAVTEDSTPEDRELLQGTWMVKHGDYGLHWTFDGDRLIMARIGERWRGSFYVDAHARPARIDWTCKDVHDHERSSYEGIYQVDGDTLTVAWANTPMYRANRPRPTTFENTKDYPALLVTLERVRNTEPRPPSSDDSDAAERLKQVDAYTEQDGEGNVISVSYGRDTNREHEPYPNNALVPLEKLSRLERFTTHNSWFLPESLAPLGKCSQLISFDLGRRTLWTDESLPCLANLSHLESLNVRGPAVTDTGLEALSGLTSLRRLDISETAATGAGLRHLARFPKLAYFSMTGERTGDGALANLAGCSSLKSLSLTKGDFTDRGVALLRNLKHLEILNLGSSAVTDAALASIAELKQLRHLYLSNCSINGSGIAALKALPHLETLRVDETPFDARAVPVLLELKSLKSVNLPGDTIPREQVQPLVDSRHGKLTLRLGHEQIDRTEIAAEKALVQQAVRQRWEAERLGDATVRRDALLRTEISEQDLAKLLGVDVAAAIWPAHAKMISAELERWLRLNPPDKQAKLGHLYIWPAHSRSSEDQFDEFRKLLPANVVAYDVDPNPLSDHGRYLIIDGRARHVAEVSDLLKRYRHYQLFKP